MALALLRAHALTHDARYLSRAEALFADILGSGASQSGIWWDRAHTQKATASNFGPVITAVRFGQGKVARAIYDPWYETMVQHVTHQVADHVTPDGRVDWSKYTYNTGAWAGSGRPSRCGRRTSERAYLAHATPSRATS